MSVTLIYAGGQNTADLAPSLPVGMQQSDIINPQDLRWMLNLARGMSPPIPPNAGYDYPPSVKRPSFPSIYIQPETPRTAAAGQGWTFPDMRDAVLTMRAMRFGGPVASYMILANGDEITSPQQVMKADQTLRFIEWTRPDAQAFLASLDYAVAEAFCPNGCVGEEPCRAYVQIAGTWLVRVLGELDRGTVKPAVVVRLNRPDGTARTSDELRGMVRGAIGAGISTIYVAGFQITSPNDKVFNESQCRVLLAQAMAVVP